MNAIDMAQQIIDMQLETIRLRQERDRYRESHDQLQDLLYGHVSGMDKQMRDMGRLINDL